jgi:diguanylate cyclase (GGDEF)-like protein
MGIPLDSRQIQQQAAMTPALGAPTGLLENTFAALDQFRRENIITSEVNNWGEEWQAQHDLALKHGVDLLANWNQPPDQAALQWMAETGRSAPEYWHQKRDQQVAALKQQFPDAGFKTNEEMFVGMTERLAQQRAGAESVRARATGPGQFGAFLGDTAGAVSDPLVALTLPFGASAGASILRASLTEAVLASATEAAIQPQVAQFRAAIGNPQAEGEAMRNILLAGAGAGTLAAGLRAIPVGYRALAQQFRKEVDAGRIKPNVQQQAALDLLERQAAEEDSNPFNRSLEGATEAHAANLKAADTAAREGTTVKAADLQAPERPADAGELIERRSNTAKRQEVENLQARVSDLKGKLARGEATQDEVLKALDDLDNALHTSTKAPALKNERAFNNFLAGKENQPVLFFDLDNFKKINDELSHDVGDQVINAVGNLAREVSDELGIPVFHKGGDEFLGGGADSEALTNLGKAVQKRLSNANIEVELPDGSLKTIKEVRLSFGVSSGKTVKDSVNAAEAALIADKQRRKAAGLRTDRPDELPGGQPGRENPQNRVPQATTVDRVPRETRDPELIEQGIAESDAQLKAEVDALLLENPELKVAGEPVADEAGEVVSSTVTARQLLEEADAELAAAAEFTACVAGTTEAAA